MITIYRYGNYINRVRPASLRRWLADNLRPLVDGEDYGNCDLPALLLVAGQRGYTFKRESK